MSEDENDFEESDGSISNEDGVGTDDDCESENGNSTGKDGLADMMSKILNQQVKGKTPVLAKRKTAAMKEMEAGHDDSERLKKARLEKKAQREKQLHIPDHNSADYERQLRKLATRGVVALFNAISKSKRDSIAVLNGEKDEVDPTVSAESKKNSEIKLARQNFLEMIHKDKESGVDAVSTTKAAHLKESSTSKGKSSDRGKTEQDKKKQGWAVLRDDFMVDKSLSLKNWDRGGDSSDEASAVED